MRFSIYVRTVIILNVFVLGLATAIGWVAQDTASRVVEERLVKEMVVRVSGFMKEKRLPLTDEMMRNLHDIFGADWIATTEDGAVAASSMDAPLTEKFRESLDAAGKPGVVRLGGGRYRMDSVELTLDDYRTGLPARRRLFMLAADAQFAEARRKASLRILEVVLPAVAAATLLAVLFAFTITRPIRKLAAEMDRLGTEKECGARSAECGVKRITETAEAATKGEDGALFEPARDKHTHRGPTEVRQLASSFHLLLQRLEASRARLAQSERLAALGTVCLSVAHELRNPLSAIKMNVRILQDSAKSPADDAEVKVILREIERMELYLNELMSLAPGGDVSARSGPTLAPARLSELAEGVLQLMAGRCAHAKVRVVREFPPDESPARADANQIRQVMMNLAVNAIEAMPGGGEMTVAIKSEAASVVLSVSDTGGGVRCEPGTDVFDAFVTTKPNGTGIGLYLSRQIVVAHGGRIGYENTGKGARFWVELPT